MAGISGTLAYDPSQLAGLNPGANTSGGAGSTLGPMTTGPSVGTVGGNPLIPSMPTGQAVNTNAPMPPGSSDPYAATGATAALAGLGGGTGGQGALGMGFTGGDLAKSLQSSGYRGGVGTALSQFLQSGAGFNPAVAQAMIAALQPQFAKGQANLMEQFGAQGLAGGSPAALGMGDYMAQENLDVGTLLSGMYEQSIQNYMGVLESAKTAPKASWWQAASSLIGSITGGGVTYAPTTNTGGGDTSA